jgi:hypothetical protein
LDFRAYRLAKHLSDYGQHEEAADLLFQNLFPIKGEINEQQHMFKVSGLCSA